MFTAASYFTEICLIIESVRKDRSNGIFLSVVGNSVRDLYINIISRDLTAANLKALAVLIEIKVKSRI